MQKTSEKGKLAITLLTLFFGFVYFTAYLAKKSYAVVIPAILDVGTGLTKDQLSIPVTCLFICYGVCQIFAGFFCDKSKNPKIIGAIALCVSAVCNFLVPFSFSNVVLMSVTWSINGLAQAFVWPSLVKLASYVFNEKELPTSMTAIAIGGYVGQCLLYLLAFLFVRTIGFQCMFYFTGAIALAMALVLFIIKQEDSETLPMEKEIKTVASKQNILLVFIVILILVILCGALKDSLETWTPTYIKEAFNLGSDKAIISGIIMPILSIIFVELSLVLYKKVFKNPITLSLAFFAACFLCILVLFISKNSNVVLSLILMALAYGFMCAINHTIIDYIPIYYKNTGKMSSLCAIMNAFTYIGSAGATYLIGYISKDDVFGWNGAIVAWIILVVACIAISIAVMFPWNKEHKGLPEE